MVTAHGVFCLISQDLLKFLLSLSIFSVIHVQHYKILVGLPDLYISLRNFRWSAIAARLPGRTDNEIKNVWHTHLKKRLKQNQVMPATTTTTNNKSFNLDSSEPTIPRLLENSVHAPMSPQPSSSEISSVTDASTSTGIGEANNIEIKGEDMEYSMESFPLIDESFWSDNPGFLPDEYSSDSSGFSCFNADSQTQYSLAPMADNVQGWPSDGVSHVDNGMDFWYDLFIRAGGAEELPAF